MPALKPLLLVGLLVAAAGGLYTWWAHQEAFPSTDDATLQADVLTIAPQVAGKVETVAVVENGYVKAGDVLFTLDAAAMQAAVNAARAQLDLATLSTGASTNEVAAAEANVTSATAALAQAEADIARDSKLAASGDLAPAGLEKTQTARDQAAAAKAAAEAALAAARDQAGGGRAPAIKAAQAALDQAQLALSHATVTAPASGWVANLRLRPGQVVSAGQPLFSIVEDGNWWVDANFKETDLAHIVPGQSVAIDIDMYPGQSLTGKVESLGAGSGAVFSLLPAQNATGNWVKVTQRFPVRISLDPLPFGSPVQLRVGASVTATVDAQAAPKAVP
ncbi:MAG: HlyD family efflux transporter periplasmic adaptor subunit [Paracoccaceae bacterium]